MKVSPNTRRAITFVLIGVSFCFWMLLLLNPGHTVKHCHVSDSGPSSASLHMLLEMNPFSSLLLGWGVMVVAMMLPKLVTPIRHIYATSFRNHRFMTAMLFIVGYITIWMLAGVLMIAVTLRIHLIWPNSYVPAFCFVVMALAWQFSPLKQKCLNKGHHHWNLKVFGWAARKDALWFGIVHGIWCVGAGWALMLFPMLLPIGHNVVMLLVTFVMIGEHFEHPRTPQWRFIYPVKLIRFSWIQIQTRLKWDS